MPAPLEPDKTKGLRPLVIVQSFVPHYRVRFFEELKSFLAQRGVDLHVAAATPPPSIASRRDAALLPWIDMITCRWFRLFGRDVAYRKVSRLIRNLNCHHVIVEQAIRNLETMFLLLPGKRVEVAMWGHGGTYSFNQGAPSTRIKEFITRRSSWFFSYTPAGMKFVSSLGFPQSRTTVVWNSNDSSQLRTDISSLTLDEQQAFIEHHKLTRGKIGLFMGGVDSRKGIEFLHAAARLVHESVPDFKLLIAGTGDLIPWLSENTRDHGEITLLGRVDGRDKALALSVSSMLLIPEWIGLVAVDSLASGVPIVTTAHFSHAPEFEYLSNDTMAVSKHAIEDYAALVVDLITDDARLQGLRGNCYQQADTYSAERMAECFGQGVLSWMGEPS